MRLVVFFFVVLCAVFTQANDITVDADSERTMANTPESDDSKQNEFQILSKDVYFQPGGGIRLRYENLFAGTGRAFTNEEDESQASHRAQLDFRLYKGEFVETFFRLINYAEWGGVSSDSSGGQKDSFSKNNGLLVNQAWALWKMDDLVGFKFGRTPIDFGLGLTYGANEWFNVPYSFDLASFSFDWESTKVVFGVVKVQELTKVANQTLSPDPEENHIIVNVNVGNYFDSVNMINFSLIQVNRDLGSGDGGATVLNGLNVQRLALESELTGKRFFGSFFVSYVTGKEKVAPINQVNGLGELNIKQRAFDFKFGYRMPENNDLSFWAGFHSDSGDENLSDDTSQTYDSFYYDVYGQAGIMDFVRWGNLNYYRIGLDVDLTSTMTLGAEWLGFSRAEATDSVQFGQAGRFMQAKIKSNDITLAGDKKLGDEIDIWIDFRFDSGMTLKGTFSSFFPGGAFEGAVATSGSSPGSSVSQVLTQIGYFF